MVSSQPASPVCASIRRPGSFDVEAGRAAVERAQLATAERAHEQHLHAAIEGVAIAHPAIHRQVVGSADVWNPVLVADDIERCVVEQSSHAPQVVARARYLRTVFRLAAF